MIELDRVIDSAHRKINYHLMKISFRSQIEAWINYNRAWDWFTRSFSCIKIHMDGLEFVSMYQDLPNVFIKYSGPDSISEGLDNIKTEHMNRYFKNKRENGNNHKILPYCVLPSVRFTLLLLIFIKALIIISFSIVTDPFLKLALAIVSLATMIAIYSSYGAYKWVSTEGKLRYEKAEKEGYNYFTVITNGDNR